MGLFNRETYHCVICGTKVRKKTIQLSDQARLCDKCDRKVMSIFVKKYIRSEYGYKDIDSKQMQQMQEFFDMSAKRAGSFVTSYYQGNFCFDQTHGWFFITRNDAEEMPFKHNLKYYSNPIEIFSICEVDKLEYTLQLGSTNWGQINFYFKNEPLPYIPYHSITISQKMFETEKTFKQRVAGIAEEISMLFPGVEFRTPEDESRAKLAAYYSDIEEEIGNLLIRRQAVNNQVDSLMAGNISDKYRSIAKQYLELDKLLSKDIDLLVNKDNFSSVAELQECKESATSYLAQMMCIFMDLQKTLS